MVRFQTNDSVNIRENRTGIGDDMQIDNAKQGTGWKWAKWLAGAMLIPVLGVPASKLAERYFDMSFFSPAISELGNWLSIPLTVPLWVVFGVLLITAVAMGILLRSLNLSGEKLTAANAKIAALQTPSVSPLTKNQEKVIAAIAAYDSADKTCRAKEFSPHIGLTLLESEGALDVLENRKLISVNYAPGGKVVTLSPTGRAYVLHPDFDMPLLPFSEGK
jgi:hypothetical protein